ncbi:hypothetical protein EAO75_04125 [Streptomyces sp. uw30]|nr:hypothetical protein EAO75_04125 [Streptomyces sp. uw30]
MLRGGRSLWLPPDSSPPPPLPVPPPSSSSRGDPQGGCRPRTPASALNGPCPQTPDGLRGAGRR